MARRGNAGAPRCEEAGASGMRLISSRTSRPRTREEPCRERLCLLRPPPPLPPCWRTLSTGHRAPGSRGRWPGRGARRGWTCGRDERWMGRAIGRQFLEGGGGGGLLNWCAVETKRKTQDTGPPCRPSSGTHPTSSSGGATDRQGGRATGSRRQGGRMAGRRRGRQDGQTGAKAGRRLVKRRLAKS